MCQHSLQEKGPAFSRRHNCYLHQFHLPPQDAGTKCKESFSLEITLQEQSGKQHNVTVFPKTMESFYQKKNKIIQINELEYEILEFRFLDFTVNHRKIVIKMEDHLETLLDDRVEQVTELIISIAARKGM